jgi:two-component system nitrogen regulation response regulator GlnG
VLKQGILHMRGRVLLAEYLPAQVRNHTAPASGEGFNWDQHVADRLAAGTENLYAETLELMERELLVRVLRFTQGNQLKAARILGITRGSLRTKIKALRISIERSISADEDAGE